MDEKLLPFEHEIIELIDFTLRMRRLRGMCPYSVTSGLRTPERNGEVGGSPRSLHLIDLARDCVPGRNISREALYSYAHRVGLYGVIEKDHVHLQSRPAKK